MKNFSSSVAANGCDSLLAAAKSFQVGDRVKHPRKPNIEGTVTELESRLAVPQVWVEWDNPEGKEYNPPHSYSPRDLVKSVLVEVVEELTEDEAKDRYRLELKVERAFYEAAIALRELHDRKLYRSTHSRFDHYCRDRFGFSQQNADLLIRAAGVIDNLKVTTIGCNFLPTSERQVRPLTKLSPDKQREVWHQAVEEAGGFVPSGRIVKGIVERLKAKPIVKATDFCQQDDVFTLTGLVEGHRKYNGCWAIAKVLKDFTVEVEVHDVTLTVKPENLN